MSAPRHKLTVTAFAIVSVAVTVRSAELVAIPFEQLLDRPFVRVEGAPNCHGPTGSWRREAVAGASGGAAIRYTAQGGAWSIQWWPTAQSLATDITYTFYARIRIDRNADVNQDQDVFGGGLYKWYSGRETLFYRPRLTARQLPNREWALVRIGTFHVTRAADWYLFCGLVSGKKQNAVSTMWFDAFIAVPEVTAATKPALQAHADRYASWDAWCHDLQTRVNASAPSYNPRLTQEFAYGAYVPYEKVLQMSQFFGETPNERWRRLVEWMVRHYMDTAIVTNIPAKPDTMAAVVKAAGESGLRLAPILRVPAEANDPAETRRRLTPFLEQFKEDPNVLTWYLFDEPNPSFFPSLMDGKLYVDKVTPQQSGFFILNHTQAIEAFGRHMPVLVVDRYEISDKSRNPWSVLDWVTYSRETSGRPVWMMFQAVGKYGNGSGHRCPTEAEFRLMHYLTLAGGGSGIVPYLLTSLPIYVREGQATAHDADFYMEEFEFTHPLLGRLALELGRELTPVGRVMIDAKPVPTAPLATPSRSLKIADGRTVPAIAVQQLDKDNASFFVVYNQDTAAAATGRIPFPLQAQKRELYDLGQLTQLKLESDSLSVDLPPGHGRVLAALQPAQWPDLHERLLAARIDKETAITALDLTQARRCGLRIEPAAAALGEAQHAQAGTNQRQQALDRCRLLLKTAWLEADGQARVLRDAEHCRAQLGQMSHHCSHDPSLKNMKARQNAAAEMKALGTRFLRAYNAFRAGQWQSAAKPLANLAAELQTRTDPSR
ncbi:MAG: hypothetical protein HN742_19480 [Lentisphaerae bacterium]|jgi:hypothetical protein|nr:hypothetical protein [Lentisphaerota bacterium]MBT4815753.1 hypothetical protein [Lentisphaerota bacterium]MBT5605710.1 hypothetical protein [Lentisphaerota bacterium]MBT7055435.1 hypothetical protein [Lentisphaerota bacterium]MBT7844071.1 hypothetical protein [Lentisphaerota bacterium]